MYPTAIEAMIMKKYNISAEDFKVMETVILKSEPHKAGDYHIVIIFGEIEHGGLCRGLQLLD